MDNNLKLYLGPINVLSNGPFRKLCLELGADYVFTEMVWANRILDNDEYELRKLDIENQEQTIIQIISEEEDIAPFIKFLREKFPKINELNFNMGCPQSTLIKRNLGGGILKDQEKMARICRIFYEECRKYNFLPSVKIRIGIDFANLEEYVELIKNNGINKIYVHARTLTQGYVKKADYSVYDNIENIELIVNGDIVDLNTLRQALSHSKQNSAMIARQALRDPAIFLKLKSKPHITKKEIILKFLNYANSLAPDIVKKNISWLTEGIVGGSEIRFKINNVKTVDKIKEIIENTNEITW